MCRSHLRSRTVRYDRWLTPKKTSVLGVLATLYRIFPVIFPVSRETEPENRQTETGRARSRLSADGDRLRRHGLRQRPGNFGVFRESFGETTEAETRWRREGDRIRTFSPECAKASTLAGHQSPTAARCRDRRNRRIWLSISYSTSLRSPRARASRRA